MRRRITLHIVLWRCRTRFHDVCRAFAAFVYSIVILSRCPAVVRVPSFGKIHSEALTAIVNGERGTSSQKLYAGTLAVCVCILGSLVGTREDLFSGAPRMS